jgi:hypothetical protein
VKTGDHVFGECLRHDYSHLPLLDRLPILFVIGTATFLHCIERDDYTDKRYAD